MKHIIFIIISMIFIPLQMDAQESQNLEKVKEKMLQNAIEIGKSYNFSLDYSDESINNVESILSDINSEYVKNKNEEGLRGIALIFSFYIVAVIEKNHGKGKLERDDKSIGKDTFPFYWNGSTLFPYGWCLKRIYDGDGDNIAIKYKMLVLKPK
ncbi:hypothetical protein [Flavobacterium sp. LM4]|uniref:hypothetical protein n=1 Tax=Flavobacterium sp. LM4 TaxID=1938609 RepID=UPI000F5079A6|nr:hypothetical protein [Flavobacterium sp. LM4]